MQVTYQYPIFFTVKQEIMQTIYAVVCYHVKRKNIKLVLCARVYNEYELSRGGEIHSGICVPKIISTERGLTELLIK